MEQNINQGKELFDKIGEGPGDMYMAFLHSKMCSEMILAKSERIGSSSSGFTLDGYINAIKERHTNPETGEYDMDDYIRKIAVECNKAQKPLPSFVALLGSFDREAILKKPELKEKKPKPMPRKRLTENEEPTRHEEVNLTAEQRAEQQKNNPEVKAKDLYKTLQGRVKSTPEPIALYDFGIGHDLAETAEKMLLTAFLARDGCVSITRFDESPKAGAKKLDCELVVKPENPPKKVEAVEDQGPADTSSRRQHIVSFNGRTFRAIQQAVHAASQGEPSGSKSRKVR